MFSSWIPSWWKRANQLPLCLQMHLFLFHETSLSQRSRSLLLLRPVWWKAIIMCEGCRRISGDMLKVDGSSFIGWQKWIPGFCQLSVFVPQVQWWPLKRWLECQHSHWVHLLDTCIFVRVRACYCFCVCRFGSAFILFLTFQFPHLFN